MFLYDDLFEEYIKNIQADSTELTSFLLQDINNTTLKTNFINYINTTNIPSELNKFDLFLDDLNIYIFLFPHSILEDFKRNIKINTNSFAKKS